MKLTENFKNHLIRAKAEGKERVYSIVGAYGATTYCVFHRIDDLLSLSTGYNFGNQRPSIHAGMWTDHPNTRMVKNTDVMYSNVFNY